VRDELGFHIEVGEETGPTPRMVLTVHGDLDYTHGDELGTVLEHQLAARDADGRPLCVVVDLADVTYCDSCGLRVLLGAHQRVDGLGGELVLRGVSGQPQRALRLTGLDTVLHAVDLVEGS
jgi:anti-sigma B factor antagonist